MNVIETKNGSEAYCEILSKLHGIGYQAGKFKEIENVTIFIRDLTKAIPLSNKNYWAWAFVEALERVDPNYQNPGIAWRLRPNWTRKLTAEGGTFCYSYSELMAEQIPIVCRMLKKKLQREAILSVWRPEHLTRRSILPRVPCTISLHLYRSPVTDLVNLHVTMRSSDVPNLLSFDLFHHSFLCQYICAKAGLQPGSGTAHFTHSYMHQKRGTPEKLRRELAVLDLRTYQGNFNLLNDNLEKSIQEGLEIIRAGLEDGKLPPEPVDHGNLYIDTLVNAVLWKLSKKKGPYKTHEHSFFDIV